MNEESRWLKIRRSPILFTLWVFVVCNFITMILTGSINIFGVLLNLLPTMFAYFTSTLEKERRLEDEQKSNINRFKA